VPEAAAAEEAPSRPCASRVRDAMLGGSRNLAADRDAAAALETRFPALPAAARDAREFKARAVTWAAGQGIRQFVACGAGLPLPGAVHEVARAVIPSARVVYACHPGDASGLACARAVAAACPGVAVVRAGVRPDVMLASPAVAAVVDVGEPACVVLPMIVHLMPAGDARDMVAGVAARLAPGSAVIVSAAVPDETAAGDELIAACAPWADVYRHPPSVITGWLEDAGLAVMPPGVADVRGFPARRAPVVVAGVVARLPLGGVEACRGGALIGAAELVGVGGYGADDGEAGQEAAGVGELAGEPHHLGGRRVAGAGGGECLGAQCGGAGEELVAGRRCGGGCAPFPPV
jgi:hypothetical protein